MKYIVTFISKGNTDFMVFSDKEEAEIFYRQWAAKVGAESCRIYEANNISALVI